MEIKDDAFYSIADVQKIVNWSNRKLQRYAKKNSLKLIDNRYIFKGYQVKEIIISNDIDATTTTNDATTTNEFKLKLLLENKIKELETLNTENIDLKARNKKLIEEAVKDIPHQEKLKKAIQLITLEALEQGITHKIFTEEEYQDLIGTISEVDFQKEQVQYLRTRVEKQDIILQELVQQTTQRNFITAKEKGFDKD